MTSAADLRELLGEVTAIARRAGEEILDVYRAGPMESERKADDSPLTLADLRSHRLIVPALRALTPQWPVLSEEASGIDWHERRAWDTFWLVDPLDGTREFLARNGQFTVNIALVRQQRAVLGVVHQPVKALTHYGAAGVGAWRHGLDGAAEEIRVQPRAAEPLRILGSRSHRSDALAPVLDRIGEHELLAVGSSIKFCLVAEGSADLYPRLGPTSEWDTAAGQALLEAAGGTVLHAEELAPLRYNARETLLNPDFLAYADAACLERWLEARAAVASAAG